MKLLTKAHSVKTHILSILIRTMWVNDIINVYAYLFDTLHFTGK
jgi:hypothetical protein